MPPAEKGSPQEALWAEILSDCAWETIPKEKIRRLSALITPSDVPWLMQAIASLELAALEEDAGDISDEYWRITVSASEAIAPLGAAVKPYLTPYLGSTHRYVQMALGFLRNKGVW